MATDTVRTGTIDEPVALTAPRRGQELVLPQRPGVVFVDGCARVERDAEPSFLVDGTLLLVDDGAEPLALRAATDAGVRALRVPLAAGVDPAARVAPCPAALYLAHWRVARALRWGFDAPGARAHLAAELARLPPAGRRAAPAALQVEDAMLLLAREFPNRLALSDIALVVESSAFHLCRLFRRATGYSIHGYRDQLRVRRALDMLGDARGALSEVGLALGYASHSHFTLAFRRAFGAPPVSFLRTIVTADAGAGPDKRHERRSR